MYQCLIGSLFGSKATKATRAQDISAQSSNPAATLDKAVDESITACDLSDLELPRKVHEDELVGDDGWSVLDADADSLSDCDTIRAPTCPTADTKRSPDTESLKSVGGSTLGGDRDWIYIARKSSTQSTKHPLGEVNTQGSSEKKALATDSANSVLTTRTPRSIVRNFPLPDEFWEIYALTKDPEKFTGNDYKRGAKLLEAYRMPSRRPQSSQSSSDAAYDRDPSEIDDMRIDLRIVMEEVDEYGIIRVDPRYC